MFPFPFSSKRTSGGSGASSLAESGSQTSLVDPSLQSNAHNDGRQGGNAHISLPLSAHLLARSASFPSPPPTAGFSRPKPPKHFSQQISSTQFLKLDPRIVSTSDDGYFGSGSKQLSPIVEQDYFSPERRALPLPIEDAEKPVTPNGSEHSETPRHSPVYSTFLARPLKRSISQMSQMTSRTHRSTSSAPSIPPLDLLPTFSSNLEAPSLLTTSRLTAAPLPPIPAATTGPYEYRGDSDASSLHAESFISARSAAPSVWDGLDQRVDLNPYSQAERGSIVRSNTTRSSQSASSSNIDRRWTALAFGSNILHFSKSQEESHHNHTRHTPARLLFWLGFIAPWCWMVGGWMLTDSGQTKPEGNNDSNLRPFVLSLWTTKKGSEKRMEVRRGKEKEANGAPNIKGYGFTRGYPFIAPSVETLTSSGKVLRMKPTAGPKILDLWVVRCRVASVMSGILLLTGFVVAFVEVGKGR